MIDKMYIMFPNYTYNEENNTLEYVDSSSNSEKALQNRIIELYKSMLLHPDNINKIMTPLDHVHIKNDAINLSNQAEVKNLDNFDFIKDIETKYSFMAGMAGVGQLANAFVDYAMGSITDYSIKGLYQFEKSGQDIFKNQGKANSKLDMFNSVTLSDKDLADYFTEFSKNASAKEIEELKQNLENFRTIPISDSLSALMNAFVDIAKDPYITNINWNTMTTNTGVMLLRMGVHPFYVNALFAQPIIKEYIEFTSSYESNKSEDQRLQTTDVFFRNKVSKNLQDVTFKTTNGNEVNAKFLYDVLTSKDISLSVTNINNALRQVLNDELDIKLAKDETLDGESLKTLNEYHDSYFNTDKFNNALDWDLKQLRNQVFEPSEKKQQNIIKTFLTFQGKAKKSIKPFVDASKHSVNGVGKDSTQLLMALNRIQNISKNGVIGYNNKMYYNDGTPKLLGHYYENNLLGTAKIIQANPTLFISANQNIWNTYNIISQQIYNESLNNQELADKLEKTFYSYLMSGFGPFNLKGSEINNIVNTFPSELLEFKTTLSENENYFILNQLQTKIVRPKTTKTPSKNQLKLYIPNKKNSAEYDNKMMNSFKDLLKYHPETAKKLIQYSFFTSGFNLGADTFYQYIPPTFFIENGFNEYVKDYNRNLNKEDLNFIDQFYLANLSDRQIVRNIYINPKSDKVDMTSYEGVILLDSNNERYQTGKYFVRTIETTDQYGQKKNIEVYYKMLGYLNGKVVLSNNIPSQLGYGRIDSININDKGYRQVRFSQDLPVLPTSLKMQEKLKPQFEEIMSNIEFEQLEVEQVNTEIETKQEVKSEINNIEVVERYSISDVQSNPNKIYVFGDNLQRTGTGGQAVIRNNENAFGIATKLKPTKNEDAYMYDDNIDMNKQNIDSDINKIKNDGRIIVFPKDGLGTGLAKLKEKAPQTYVYLKQRLLEEFGFDNDTGEVFKTKRDNMSKTPVFDTLPNKSNIPTMTYAGIGSRETPQEILDEMTELASMLEEKGYTLRSGGAKGADSAFESGVKSKKEIFKGFDKTGENEILIAHEIHPNLKGVMEGAKRRAESQGKDGQKSALAVENLMARNTNQIFGKDLNSPVDFVIAYDPSGWIGEGKRPQKGGTLQGIDMASRKDIPVINLANPDWKTKLNNVLEGKQITKPQQLSLFETTPESIINIKKEALKTLFNKSDNNDVFKGSVVEYKDKKWIVWNISDNNRAQLIDTEGNKFSGTPDVNKLKSVGTYKTTIFNGTDYIVTSNENIYSLDTGKQVFTSLDNSTKTQKERIINQILDENNLSENVLNQINKEFGTDKVLEYIKKCKQNR